MLIRSVVTLARALPRITFGFGVFVALDWLLFSHALLENSAFLQKVSFFTAILTITASAICMPQLTQKISERAFAVSGLVFCAILGLTSLQGLFVLGTASPASLVGFGSLFLVVLLRTHSKTDQDAPSIVLSTGILLALLGLFVFGLLTWHHNQQTEINGPVFSFFSPATGTLLYLLAVCYLDHFCFTKKEQGLQSPARDMMVALCLIYPFILAGGLATGDLIVNRLNDVVAQGLGGAMTTVLMGALLISFGWNTWKREEAALNEAENSNRLLAKQLVQTKSLEAEARRLAESNEAYANEQRHFSTMLAHEIRTPLNTITGLVNGFGGTFNASATCQMKYCNGEFGVIKESTDYLYDLVNSVLDYNKLKEGRLEVENEVFSPATLASAVDHFYRDRATLKGLDFSIEIAADLPKELVGDAVRIRQVVSNLLDNAIKFTEAGSVNLVISQEAANDGNQHVVFKVTDTGIGIDPKDMVRIFEPFRQANAHIRSKFGGTGVGLSLCKDLASLMSGSLTLSSQLGRGATFELRLPLVENLAGLAGGNVATVTNHLLLMVEDHHINAKINQRILEGAGYTVDWVDNGEAAVEAVRKIKYDAVLMDLDLGAGISGYETAKRICLAPNSQRPPILALTAALTGEIQEELKAVGIEHSLDKPFSVESASRLISKAIQSNKGEGRQKEFIAHLS